MSFYSQRVLLGVALSSVAIASQSEIDRIRLKYQLPVLAGISVVGKDSSVYVSGIRKWGDPTQAKRTDKFHLGSCTKAMTATLLVMFIEKGHLTWDSTLESLFPEYRSEMKEAFKKVSVGMLTAHRSGITEDLVHFQSGQLWQKLWDKNLDPVQGRKLVTHKLLSSPPASVPGSRYEYSNANYMIVGAILEKLSGKRWEELMRKKLFEPLRMESCGFGVQADPKAVHPDQPWPHLKTAQGPSAVIPAFSADNPPTLGPAGTVHCSLEDWAKFAQFHLDGFNGKSSELLSAVGFQKLHQSYPGQEYTFGGWIRVNRPWARGPALTHAGSNTMNYANIWIAPLRKISFLSATNMGGDDAAKATDEVVGVFIKNLPLEP